MKFFVEEILEDERVKQELYRHPKLSERGRTIAEYIMATHEYPNVQSGLLPIFILGHLADYALNTNLEHGISKEITVSTLKDINIWLDNYEKQYGVIGLGEFHWLILHYTSRLFRLGRLQFQLTLADYHIPSGDFVIETHIPQGEPLDFEECRLSFLMAATFYQETFPEYKADYFMCHSWLLNPYLGEILDESTNIVRFMRLWSLYDTPSDNSAQAIERVFGFGFQWGEIMRAPENTGLQRALKKHLLSGKSLDAMAGYMCISQMIKK